MGLKVIGAGLSRTGTFSLKHALEKLGFDECYHGLDFAKNREHIDLVYPGIHGEKVDWDSVFTGKCQAAVDFPSALFYKQMMEAYPDAKVILTVRETEKWYESVYESVWKPTRDPESFKKMFNDNDGKLHELLFHSEFMKNLEDKEATIREFEKHTEEVKATVPSDKLLIFSIKEGWEPLCKFLDVDIPSIPFPRVNDRQSLVRKLEAAEEGGIASVSKDLLSS